MSVALAAKPHRGPGITHEVAAIQAQVPAWVADPAIEVVLTTGGAGFAPRDITPEAVRLLLTRVMDRFSGVSHQASQTTVGISALQSRALAGQIPRYRGICT